MRMSQIRQDPQKIREFCSELNSHVMYWGNSVMALENYTARLGSSWRDEQFEEFRLEVIRLRRSLDGFCDQTRQAIALLIEDAEKLEKLQNIKV